MGSSSKKSSSSRYSPVIVTGEGSSGSSRSSSTSSHYTMSSQGGRSSLGAGSDSYRFSGSSQYVTHDTFRNPQCSEYMGSSYYRQGTREGRDVVTYNYNTRGHEEGAPTPGYSPQSSRSEKSKAPRK